MTAARAEARRRFAVGGVTVELAARPPLAAAAVPAFYRAYTAGGGRPSIRIDVHREPVARPAARDLAFDSEGLWRVYRAPQGWIYTFRAPVGDEVTRSLSVDRDWQRGRLSVGESTYATRRAFALFYPLDELLLQHHLARHGGLVIHASAVLLDGRAVLFCGQSGAGKTTTSRLWRRHERRAVVLSDDRVILRRRRGRLWAYGTPWHGEAAYGSPASGPVAALLFLEHAPETVLEKEAAPLAAAQLLARSFPPVWDGDTLQRALATCDAACASVPAYRLGFRPDGSAVEAVRPLLRKTTARRR